MTLKIKKSKTADTRSCDYANVTKEQLNLSNWQHRSDVRLGMNYLINQLRTRTKEHDHTKISHLDQFHADFITGFKEHSWLDMHAEVERHHITHPKGVKEDINLIDIIEHIVDCVMAGMARSGSVFPIELPNEMLQKAVKNTVDIIKGEIEVEE